MHHVSVIPKGRMGVSDIVCTKEDLEDMDAEMQDMAGVKTSDCHAENVGVWLQPSPARSMASRKPCKIILA